MLCHIAPTVRLLGSPNPAARERPPSCWAPRPRARCPRPAAAAAAADAGAAPQPPPPAFGNLERLISDGLGSAPGSPGSNWREVEGCWVCLPPEAAGPPRALVHFVGGAFIGAAPLAYAPLLEALAARGAAVVATPYATSFDHLRTADDVWSRFQRCVKALGREPAGGAALAALPAYGVGHSLGALVQLLIASRFLVPRAGNVLMSFNNRPATDAIPLLSPFIAPAARQLGPLLAQLATSPLRSGVEQWVDVLKGVSPAAVRQVLPVLEQLAPIYLDVSQGAAEFVPPPEEVRALVRDGYSVPRNLLLRFERDEIDQTPALASVLQSSAVAGQLELTVKTLPGDHVRPLQQDLASRVPPDVARAATAAVAQSETLWGQLGALAEQSPLLPDAAKQQLLGLTKAAAAVAQTVGEAVSEDAGESIEALADVVAEWMRLPTKGAAGAAQRVIQLPPPPPAEAA